MSDDKRTTRESEFLVILLALLAMVIAAAQR